MSSYIVIIFQSSSKFRKCAISVLDYLLDINSTPEMRVINDPEKYKSFADALGDGRVPDGVVLFSHGDSDLLQFVSKKGLVPATWWQCSIPINSFFGYCCNSANILSQNSYDYIVKDWIGYTDEIWLNWSPESRLPYKAFLTGLIDYYSKNTSCTDLANMMDNLFIEQIISNSEAGGNEHFRTYFYKMIDVMTTKHTYQEQ